MRAIDIVEKNQIVACAQIRQVHEGTSRHAGGTYNAIFSTLHRCNLFLYGTNCWIIITMICIAVNFPVSYLPQHLEGLVVVIDGIDDRCHHGFIAIGR